MEMETGLWEQLTETRLERGRLVTADDGRGNWWKLVDGYNS